MTTQRGATWSDSPHSGKRGPNGRRLCLECGDELSEARKRFTFCGDECRRRRAIVCHPTSARWQVKERDRGICARCGLDCKALDDAIADFGFTYKAGIWRGKPLYGRQSELAVAWLRSQGFVRAGYGWKSTWEAHHAHPVVEGGGGCDLDGYETLCFRCHRAETKELHGRLADKRRGRLRLAVLGASSLSERSR